MEHCFVFFIVILKIFLVVKIWENFLNQLDRKTCLNIYIYIYKLGTLQTSLDLSLSLSLSYIYIYIYIICYLWLYDRFENLYWRAGD